MATIRAIATRRAGAERRLARASSALARKHGVELPAARSAKDPELNRALQLENVAHLLERVAVATGALREDELMSSTTPEGNGPARPNEEGYDPQLPEGAKGAVPPEEEPAQEPEGEPKAAGKGAPRTTAKGAARK